MAAIVDYSLYLVLDVDHIGGRDLERLVCEVCDGGVSVVQYRAKNREDPRDPGRLATVRRILRERGIPLIVNDDLELAIRIGADGVHLGRHDLSIAKARERTGKDFVIGASARSIEKVRIAIEDGADYLGVGSIYFTRTKKDIRVIGLDALEAICKVSTVPVVAIGGIDHSRVGDVLSRGASGIAVISAILDSRDPGSEAKRLRKRIDLHHATNQGEKS